MGAKRKNTAVEPSAETKAKKPRTSWSEVDDNIIRAYVDKKTAAGEKVSWKDLEAVLERKATRISEHWKNHLDPAINKGDFTPDEDAFILAQYGHYTTTDKARVPWSKIAQELNTGRTDNAVKNRTRRAARPHVRAAALAHSTTWH